MENEELELIDSTLEVVEDAPEPGVVEDGAADVLEVEELVVEVASEDDEDGLVKALDVLVAKVEVEDDEDGLDEALDELVVEVRAVDELRDAEQTVVAVRVEAAEIPYTEYRVVYIATGQPPVDEAVVDAVITPPHFGLPKGG
ncbi:hypothetical protein CcaCcLH18_05894 [Colletotrichum camelliae]|nr:hypothetical protein CcaCcLH18_05894 [Colletotrichum camelliae]